MPSIRVKTVAPKPHPRTHSFGLTSQPVQSRLASGSIARRRTSINLQSMLKESSNANSESILGKFAAPENQNFKALAAAILRSTG